jgi:hypothetical protein
MDSVGCRQTTRNPELVDVTRKKDRSIKLDHTERTLLRDSSQSWYSELIH